MAGIKDLTKLIKELDGLVSECVRCGVCQSVCPIFIQTGREADVARGKLALLDGLIAEMFQNPRGVAGRLEKCLLCGACEFNCSRGVKCLEIFLKARAILTGYMGLSGVKKTIFRKIIANPETFDTITASFTKIQKIFVKPVNMQLGTSCSRIASPLLKGRHITPLAQVSFHRMITSEKYASRQSKLKAAFFTGCLIDKIFPQVAKAAVDILNFHEIDVFIPRVQGCCGIPAVSSGDTEAFVRLVQYNLEIFGTEDFDFLVTACATCTHTIKNVWPMLLGSGRKDLRRKAEKISEKAIDISQLLVSVASPDNAHAPKNHESVPVTVHDPCHLKKSLDVYNEPRTLIKASPGYHLAEMPDADQCCGMGGSFNLQHYDLSVDIGNRKKDNIMNSGGQIVATGCPACMIQISDVLSRAAIPVPVKHTIEIYAAAIKKT